MKRRVLTVLLVLLVFIGKAVVDRCLSIPVYEWCEWVEGDNGTWAIYHCASPTWWDRLNNSDDWQEWQEWIRNKNR